MQARSRLDLHSAEERWELTLNAGAVLMVCTALRARGVKEASVLNLGSLHVDLPKPSSQTGEPSNILPSRQVKYKV